MNQGKSVFIFKEDIVGEGSSGCIIMPNGDFFYIQSKSKKPLFAGHIHLDYPQNEEQTILQRVLDQVSPDLKKIILKEVL